MANIDNGGLNWRLQVTDQFTAPLQNFTRLVREARVAIDGFRGDNAGFQGTIEQMRELTALTRAQTDAVRANTAAQQRGTEAERAERQAQRELIAQVRERARVERERGGIIRAQRAEQAQAAQSALALDAAIARGNVSQRARTAATVQNTGATRGNAAQVNALRTALLGSTEAGNKLVLSLRNVATVGLGILVFQTIRDSFRGLVTAGIEFNATVENSEVGVAGLLTAIADVKNAQGDLLTGAEAFNGALVVSQDQIAKLRQSTLRTTATFEQLADTFQVALAPGFRAGLDVDQIREFAVSVSQAAGALSVPTNQLSEEIRALLTGTIQARTTRIATALGIRPDDIARAKSDVGGLAKFLDDRFKAFEIAGERAAGTFTGTFNRARVAISLAAGDAAQPLFEEIRTSFLTVFDTFTNRDVFGKLLPDARVVNVLQSVFAGIADAVVSIRTSLQSLEFDDILSSAQTVGAFFRTLGQIVAGFVKGAVIGLSALGGLLRNVFGDSTDLTNLAVRFGELVTVLGLVGAGFSTINVIVGLMLLPLTSLVGAFNKVKVAMTALALLNPISAIAASVLVLQIALEDVFSIIDDANKTIAASAPENVLSASAQVLGEINDLQKERAATLQKINELEKQFGKDGAPILDAQDEKLAKINDKLKERQRVLQTLRQQEQGNRQTFEEKIKPPAVDANSLIERAAQFAKDLTANIQKALNNEEPVEVKAKVDLDMAAVLDAADREADRRGVRVTPKLQLTDFQLKLQEAFTKVADLNTQTINIMQSAVTQFGSFVADVVVDAFDPSNDTTFKERLAQFLQAFAKQIIATLTQIAVAKLILEVGIGSAGGAAEGGQVTAGGFAEGGEIAGPQHYGIDAPRPPGLHHTDTVPAWLAPGEFVLKAARTAEVGSDFMQALNDGLIDPAALRAFAGLSDRQREARRTARFGYADGGLISSQLAAAASAANTQAGSAPAASGPTPAFIVGNDLAADRFLRSGKSGVFDFFREHASTFRAMLNT